jgi:hypothetical protein
MFLKNPRLLESIALKVLVENSGQKTNFVSKQNQRE